MKFKQEGHRKKKKKILGEAAASALNILITDVVPLSTSSIPLLFIYLMDAPNQCVCSETSRTGTLLLLRYTTLGALI